MAVTICRYNGRENRMREFKGYNIVEQQREVYKTALRGYKFEKKLKHTVAYS